MKSSCNIAAQEDNILEQKTAEQSIIDLEMRIAHQDLLLEQLNQIVYQQQTKVDQLETALIQLAKRVSQTGGVTPDIGPHNEKPPHY